MPQYLTYTTTPRVISTQCLLLWCVGVNEFFISSSSVSPLEMGANSEPPSASGARGNLSATVDVQDTDVCACVRGGSVWPRLEAEHFIHNNHTHGQLIIARPDMSAAYL